MKRTEIIGNLVKDAEVVAINNSNRSVINFSVAVNDHYTDSQGVKQEKVEYFECAYWRDNEHTKVVDYLKKGVKVYVDGDPSMRIFQKADGTGGGSLKITVKYVEVLSALNIPKEN